jgi:hypothetical protein
LLGAQQYPLPDGKAQAMGIAGVHRRRHRAQRIYGDANEIVKEIMYRKRALAET